ncbi:MAG: CpaF family protein [Firmicutes bacterium]|nr:CpaF family protein [Candidatus Fermentithermobacillaceae bacterium]
MVSLLKRLEEKPSNPPGADLVRETSFEEVAAKVREKILEKYGEAVALARTSRDKREEVTMLVSELLVTMGLSFGKVTRRELAERIVQELLGLGPLDEFLEDPMVTEIMVNGPSRVYVERNGRIELTTSSFRDDRHLLDIINRIVSVAGRRIDRTSPFVDARLPDGSRVNAIVPPLSLSGPVLTIRKFPRRFTTFEELVEEGTMTSQTASLLAACVKERLDIVVSGAAGTGKTTTLNVLANSVPPEERLIVLEDSAEMYIPDRHCVRLESRPANIEGKGEVTIRDLLKNALRMRPDRIIIGECRGKETFDLVMAMNTGHEGCLSTVHANSSRDCLARMEAMALTAGEGVPLEVLRTWITAAVDVLVHQVRTPNGRRMVAEVSFLGQGLDDSQCVFKVCDQGGIPDFACAPAWLEKKLGTERLERLRKAVEG